MPAPETLEVVPKLPRHFEARKIMSSITRVDDAICNINIALRLVL